MRSSLSFNPFFSCPAQPIPYLVSPYDRIDAVQHVHIYLLLVRSKIYAFQHAACEVKIS